MYFPVALVALCLSNYFDVYGKILRYIGLAKFSFTQDFSDERIEEGKKLLSRAR